MKANIKKFDDFIKDNIKTKWNIPGLAIAMYNSDKILYQYVNGYADIEKKRKLKIDDKFCIASCSKSILCMAIAILIEKKIIPNIWEMPLDELWNNVHKDFKNVKLKKVACHTSGIVDSEKYQKGNIEKYGDMEGMKSRKLVSNIILQSEPHYKPGSKLHYSNAGYCVIGAILEKTTKTNFADIIDQYIMKPLDIDADYNEYFRGVGYASGHHDKQWYKVNGEYKVLKKGEHINPTYQDPAGKIYMSILDSAKYCKQYLKPYNKEISIIKKTTANYLTKSISHNYGYGWANNDKIIRHAGGYFCTSTQYELSIKKNIGICININAEGKASITYEIIQKFEELFL
jgi:D-alanyl-D-alanine carboxypeptidase